MRFKREIQAHIETRFQDSRTMCDGCGKECCGEDNYDTPEITIGARLGSIYPEGSSRDVHEVDVCQSCFTTRIVPALAALGFVFRVRDEDDYRDDGRVLDPEFQ